MEHVPKLPYAWVLSDYLDETAKALLDRQKSRQFATSILHFFQSQLMYEKC
jgi:hypothetical protein